MKKLPHTMLSYARLLSVVFLLAGFALSGCKTKKAEIINLGLTNGSQTDDVSITKDGHLVVLGNKVAYVVTLDNADKDKCTLNIIPCSYTVDSIKKMFIIKKGETSKKEFRLKSSDHIGAGDPGLAVQFTGVQAEISTGGATGLCGGTCCRAGCFSMYCCFDENECKDNACKCLPAGPCPGDIVKPGDLRPPVPPTNNFLDLIKSGKTQMEFAF